MSFTADTIQKVWEKAEIVEYADPNEWRKDQCGAWIGRKYYGNRNSQYSWEIDHTTPISSGGTDDLSNLHPLQWQNNAAKEGGRLTCVVAASGQENASTA